MTNQRSFLRVRVVGVEQKDLTEHRQKEKKNGR